MAFNLVSLLTNVTTPATTQQVGMATTNNPFASSAIFNKRNDFYAQNKPIQGGYFAGYYNGKPNIVGRKLFIEV